ncbi:hypothetical protein P8935_15055 [Telmatobacter sp. DSM 110680]|uniref:Uncharacterized protein n=1 Tax=Telmatobacter sp. DSM 110680 TaxID=3036704 RepID=A0AAU7DEX0_9BACT
MAKPRELALYFPSGASFPLKGFSFDTNDCSIQKKESNFHLGRTVKERKHIALAVFFHFEYFLKDALLSGL